MKSSLSPDGPGHDQASQGGKDVHTIAKSSETDSEVTKADDDVPAPALAEKQKSTNDPQKDCINTYFPGENEYGVCDEGFILPHRSRREKDTQTPQRVGDQHDASWLVSAFATV
eukprot:g34267.t1